MQLRQLRLKWTYWVLVGLNGVHALHWLATWLKLTKMLLGVKIVSWLDLGLQCSYRSWLNCRGGLVAEPDIGVAVNKHLVCRLYVKVVVLIMRK